jgi:hypothetical protein
MDSEPTTEELLRSALESMVNQFAYEGTYRGCPALITGGLSALEEAFAVLGWSDPYPAPWRQCQHPQCREWSIGGTPTPGGYKSVCHKHMDLYNRKRRAAAPTQAGEETS